MSASESTAAPMSRVATVVKWVSIGLIVVDLLILIRALPVAQGAVAMSGWIGGLGWLGPVVFGLVYVAATVLFVPGLILTIAAGTIFGLWVGTICVSVGSTLGAVLAFSIARYLARARIAKIAQRNPRFDAIDQAIAEGGWKIVALLRLSPAIPFNLQNYLYGLTRIRFWPYAVTSWLAMLPGTFMYVYVGHVTGVVVGGERARTPGEWALLAVGLLATIVVTVYITRLARGKLRQQMEAAGADRRPVLPADQGQTDEPVNVAQAGIGITPVVAVGLTAAALYIHMNPGWVEQWLVGRFGPPQVTLVEAYSEKPGGPSFDHSVLDTLLRKHVDTGGWVDYAGLQADTKPWNEYIAALGKAPFDQLGRNEKLALLINAYNTFTLRLITEHFPIKSIKDIPAADRWDDVRWNIGGNVWSLNQIEQQQIRGHFREPRIHFALVCGAIGCPPLRQEAYTADRLEQQLADQAVYVHHHPTWFQFDPETHFVRLTQLYRWYGDDFRQVAGSVLQFAARYLPRLKQSLESGKTPRIDWLPYDWKLNDQRNRKPR